MFLPPKGQGRAASVFTLLFSLVLFVLAGLTWSGNALVHKQPTLQKLLGPPAYQLLIGGALTGRSLIVAPVARSKSRHNHLRRMQPVPFNPNRKTLPLPGKASPRN